MANTTITSPSSKTVPFPAALIEATLRDELIQAAKIEASIRGKTLPSTLEQVVNAAEHLDSLVVVSIMCAIEPIVGFEISEKVVRTGGYSSVKNALDQLMPRLAQEWAKNGAKQ